MSNLLSSYERNKNYFEVFININGVHTLEDYLRYILIVRPYRLSKFETILFARILWGRNLNAINVNNGVLDLRHLKAGVINMSCLVIHIRKNRSYLTKDLLKILVYHTNILREHLNKLKSMHDYDVNHYDYCIEWFRNCITILENKVSDQEYIFSKIDEINNFVKTEKINRINFDYDKLNKSISKMTVDDFL